MAVNNLPRVPEGLRDLMKIYTKEVLREKPTNLYEFSADYFERIASRSTQQKTIRYEPPQSYEIIMKNRMRQQVPLSMVYNIIPDSLTQLIKKFIKAVLKENPQNLLLFAREYFQNLRDSQDANIEYAKYAAYEKLMQEKQSVFSAKKLKCECGRIFGSNEEEIKTEISTQSAESTQNRVESVDIYQSAHYLKAVYIIQKHCRKYLKRKREKSSKVTTEKRQIYHSQVYINAIFVIQRQIRLYLKKKRVQSAALQGTESTKVYDSARYMNAVHVIQRYCRQHLKRKALKKQTLSKVESNTSQEHNVSLMTAAFIIQRAFKRMVRVRKSRKHINAELDQNDYINDNASEAASYTSASTALLSTESACDHLDFGGNNYEEGVHQQTIKEDEEVDNDNTNQQRDYVTATIKSAGKSIIYIENDDDNDSKETLLSKLEGDKLDGFFEQVNKMDADNKIESGKPFDNDFPAKKVVKRQVSNKNIENETETKVNNESDDKVQDDEIMKISMQTNASNIRSMNSVEENSNNAIPVKEDQINPVNISIDNIEAKHLEPEQETTLKPVNINNIEKKTKQEADVAETYSKSEKMGEPSKSVEDKKVVPLKKSETEPESTSIEHIEEVANTQSNKVADELCGTIEENSKTTDEALSKNMYSVEVNSLQEVLKNNQVKNANKEIQQNNTEVNTPSATAESENLEDKLDTLSSQKRESKEYPKKTQSHVEHPEHENSIDEIANSVKIQSVLPGEDDYEIMLTPQIVIDSGSSSQTTDTTEIANNVLNASEGVIENKNTDQNVDTTDIQKTRDSVESSLESTQIPENKCVDEIIIKEIAAVTKASEILNDNLNKKQLQDSQDKDVDSPKQLALENDKKEIVQVHSITDLKKNSAQVKLPSISSDTTQDRVESLETLHSAQYLKAVYIIQKHCRKYLKRKLSNQGQVKTDKGSGGILNQSSANKTLEKSNLGKNYAEKESKVIGKQTILTTENNKFIESSEQANNGNLVSYNREDSESEVSKKTTSHMKVNDDTDKEDGEVGTVPTKANISNINNIDKIQENQPISSEKELFQLNQNKSLTKEDKQGEITDIETDVSTVSYNTEESETKAIVSTTSQTTVDDGTEKDDGDRSTDPMEADTSNVKDINKIQENQPISSEKELFQLNQNKSLTKEDKQGEITDIETDVSTVSYNTEESESKAILSTISHTKVEDSPEKHEADTSNIKDINKIQENHPISSEKELVQLNENKSLTKEDKQGEIKDIETDVSTVSYNTEEFETKAIVSTTSQTTVDDGPEKDGDRSIDPIEADTSNVKDINKIQENHPISSEKELFQLNQNKSLTKENKEGKIKDIETGVSTTQSDKQNTEKNDEQNHSTSSGSNFLVLKERKSLVDLEDTRNLKSKTEIPSSSAEIPLSEHEIIQRDQSVVNFASDKKSTDNDRFLINQKSEITADEKDRTILPESQSNNIKPEKNNDHEIRNTNTSQTPQELNADNTNQNKNNEKKTKTQDEFSGKPTETNQSLVEEKTEDQHANPTSEISKEVKPDSPCRDNKSSLLLSKQLIGTQIATPTKSKKLSNTKEKHSTSASSRLMNTPVAELQLKSFKSDSDSGAWYEIQNDLNEAIVDSNESNPTKDAVGLPQTQNKNFQTTERTPKYINGEQLETNKPMKQRQSIAYFISLDGNEEKTSYKIPKKFLRQAGSTLKENKTSKKPKEGNSKMSKPKQANGVEFEEAAADLNHQQFGAQKLQTIHEINESEASNDFKSELDRREKGKDNEVEEVKIVISDVAHFEHNLIESNIAENEANNSLEERRKIEKDTNNSNDSNRLKSARIIQRAYKNYISRKNAKSDKNKEDYESIKDLSNDSETKNLAAIKIQRIFRQFLKKNSQKKPEPTDFANKKYSKSELLAVLRIQSIFRNYLRRKQKQPYCDDISENTSAISLLTAIPKNGSLTFSETSQSRGLITPTSDDLIIDSDSELNSTKSEWFVGTQRISVESSGTPVIEPIETNTISDLFAPISESTNNTQSNDSHESKLATDIGSTLSELNAQEVYENDNADSDNLAGSANEVVKDLVQDLTDVAFAKLDASREDYASTRQILSNFLVKEIEFSSKQESYFGKPEEGDTQTLDEVQEDQCIKKTVSLNYPNQDDVQNDTESVLKTEDDDIKESKQNPTENNTEDKLTTSDRIRNEVDKEKSSRNDNEKDNENISKKINKVDVENVSIEERESKADQIKVAITETITEEVLGRESEEQKDIEKVKASKEENEQTIEREEKYNNKTKFQDEKITTKEIVSLADNDKTFKEVEVTEIEKKNKDDKEKIAEKIKLNEKDIEKGFKEVEEQKKDKEEIVLPEEKVIENEKVNEEDTEKNFKDAANMERDKKDKDEIGQPEEKVTENNTGKINVKDNENSLKKVEVMEKEKKDKEKIASEEQKISEKETVNEKDFEKGFKEILLPEENVKDTEKDSKDAAKMERKKKVKEEIIQPEENIAEKGKVNVNDNENILINAEDIERVKIDKEEIAFGDENIVEKKKVNVEEIEKAFKEASKQVFEEDKVVKEKSSDKEKEIPIKEKDDTDLKIVDVKDALLINENDIETKNIIEEEIKIHFEDKDDDSLAVVDAIDEATVKLSGPDEVIEKMSQRQLSETREKHKGDYNITEPVFDEPVIRPMSSLHDQSSLDIEDGDIIVYNRLQRDATRESSAQSDSVIFGEDGDDDKVLSNDAETARIQLSRHYTIAGEDPHSIFRTVTIDDTVQYIEDKYGDDIVAMDSTNSFYLDDETSENIRKKIMAYSLSETDSDYFDPNKVINDDSNVDTAMTDMMDTSTETESTIVSAATKIQAGARGFLTRRRLRRASAGTKSSTQETKASFGNDAISESLERFIEEEAAKKIQSAYRLHSKKQKKQTKNIKSASLEGSLAAKRMTLQRGDALRNDSNSTPEDENSNSSKTGQKGTQPKLCKDNEKRSKTKSEYAVRWPGIRQNSMPVQIESEVLRVIPKHIRKRIRSAENGKKKYQK